MTNAMPANISAWAANDGVEARGALMQPWRAAEPDVVVAASCDCTQSPRAGAACRGSVSMLLSLQMAFLRVLLPRARRARFGSAGEFNGQIRTQGRKRARKRACKRARNRAADRTARGRVQERSVSGERRCTAVAPDDRG